MKNFNVRQAVKNAMLFIFLPVVITIIIESLGSESLLGGLVKLYTSPWIFFCNALILISMLSVGVFLKRFRMFWICLICGGWLLLGVINCIIVSNRTLPFTAYDIQLIDALPIMIRKYLKPLYLALICLVLVGMVLGLFRAFFRALSAPKVKIKLKAAIIYFVIINSLTIGNLKLAINAGTLDTKFTTLAGDFVDNGFIYSFMLGVVDKGVDEVDGYSEKLISSITAEFETEKVKIEKKPNIIFLQMESFFDVNSIKNVKYSKNPIPNFTKLLSECPSGLLSVPVIGAGTANTEFEVVTGMRIADFGAGEYPYKTILVDNSCESIANNVRSHGYTSHFIHNYKGTFYGRNKVYANLGYDNFYSVEYMTGFEKNESGWAKDKILTKYILECLDSSDGADLINAVSVQGHGSYNEITDFKRKITVSNCKNDNLKLCYEYYLNQIVDMDEFLGELIDAISERKEDTVLVIYGDHLPFLELNNDDLKNRNIYQTDYIIWNNMGMEYEDENLYSYQLNSKILKSLGITDGVINSCHQKYKKDKNYHYNLQALEYDMLYGEKYAFNGQNPYRTSQMKVNRKKIEISDVYLAEGSADEYILKGEGFSENSRVRVGFTVMFTEYVDENTLKFKCNYMKETIPIVIWEPDIGESNSFYMSKNKDEQ
ncbi:MAG: LTA synthase family protein [Ruminococcaceae bacterium]|nr:LTA synthase family protein [Oscillospiraceae bacterium]